MRSRSKLLDILLDSPAHQIKAMPAVDYGIDDTDPFPFLAIIGQEEMKLALLLSVINPRIGGVLLIGPRGTGKTTAVRALAPLLPFVNRSLCVEGCTEAMLEEGGMDAICEHCRQKVGYGEPLTAVDKVRIIELPLNARLEDVVGGINERIATEQNRIRLERGILGHADGRILYIDEVNLLSDPIADAILDAAAQGHYTVRRGPLKQRYRARFTLIGSLNPEEGRLRPQLMDRFGLRAVVRGLDDMDLRYRTYEMAMAYWQDPTALSALYAEEMEVLAVEIENARELLPRVVVGDDGRSLALSLIKKMGIASARAEITLFEAARAHAAADMRTEATAADVQAVALLALRQRTSSSITQFLADQDAEDEGITAVIQGENR